MKKLLLGLLTSILLVTGCTSVTKTGALGIDRQQLMLVSYEKMDKISAEAYVKALKEAVEVWVKMNNTNVGKIPEILSTHPSNESRVKDLKEIAIKLEPIYLASKRK